MRAPIKIRPQVLPNSNALKDASQCVCVCVCVCVCLCAGPACKVAIVHHQVGVG